MCVCVLVAQECLTLCDPMNCRVQVHQLPLSIGFSRPECWSGFHSLLQGIFTTQGLSLGFLYCRKILYHLNHQVNLSPILAPPNWVYCLFPLIFCGTLFVVVLTVYNIFSLFYSHHMVHQVVSLIHFPAPITWDTKLCQTDAQ